nr:transglutaminase domain-containing protein [Planctomycetales bacterium]NIP70671.1 transglutaminase domain-containing protein [Planctomycetales bacterium]
HQEVDPLESQLPAVAKLAREPKYGNRILYFETKAPNSGSLAWNTSYRVRRQEVRGLRGQDGKTRLSDEQRRRFLAANRRVPLEGPPSQLLKGLQTTSDPLSLARSLYERVDDHVRYDKSRPGYGQGDVRWVCDSRFGNCTDFHSLFISLARMQKLPARFEIGFPLPPQRGKGVIGGYHCWALFHTAQQGWVPVDISEADKHPELKEYYFGNLTENRVTFTIGRDIELVPRQDGDLLNFFIYPYVEVNGTTWPQEKVDKRFTFRDL